MQEDLTDHEPLGDFREGQWWVQELDAFCAGGHATDEQKRAVSVVHHLLCAVAAQSDQAAEIAALKADYEGLDNAAIAEISKLNAEIAALRQKVSENELMAECTVMLRDDLIEAGIVDKTVPPMMLTEAILRYASALRKDAERYRWLRDKDPQICNLPMMCGPRDRDATADEIDQCIDAAIAQAVQPAPELPESELRRKRFAV